MSRAGVSRGEMGNVSAAASSATLPRGRGGWAVRLIPAAFVLGLLAAVAFGLYTITRDQTAGGPPKALGGMALTASETGQAALAEMTTMHQSDIHITDGWVAHYDHNAIVYVGQAGSDADALKLVSDMTARIVQGGNAMFAHQGQQSVEGLTVHVVKSGDQMHYYYGRGNKVIWIAAPVGMDPGAFVSEALQRVS